MLSVSDRNIFLNIRCCTHWGYPRAAEQSLDVESYPRTVTAVEPVFVLAESLSDVLAGYVP